MGGVDAAILYTLSNDYDFFDGFAHGTNHVTRLGRSG
jgi:hypothetical protein